MLPVARKILTPFHVEILGEFPLSFHLTESSFPPCPFVEETGAVKAGTETAGWMTARTRARASVTARNVRILRVACETKVRNG